MRRVVLAWLLVLGSFVMVSPVVAAGCAPVAMDGPRVWRAATGDGDDDGFVRITFLGHASFEIVSPKGVRAVTDYNGVNIPAAPPDIATMNHAHSTHYTLNPDPRIAHVLHGWSEDGAMPVIDLRVDDIHVTNVPTNIRTWGGGTERYGNSIFVFEAGGLCIAHLSHLHHLLEPQDLDALGRIDVVMVAVDGIWTMSQQDAAAVVDQLQPRVVLPMHYFTPDVLGRFLDREHGKYAIDVRKVPMMQISRTTLPGVPTVVVLPGGY